MFYIFISSVVVVFVTFVFWVCDSYYSISFQIESVTESGAPSSSHCLFNSSSPSCLVSREPSCRFARNFYKAKAQFSNPLHWNWTIRLERRLERPIHRLHGNGFDATFHVFNNHSKSCWFIEWMMHERRTTILSPVDFKWENDWQPEIRTDDLVKHFLWQLGLRLFLLPSASRKPIHLIYDG